jgi:hypothetical protein
MRTTDPAGAAVRTGLCLGMVAMLGALGCDAAGGHRESGGGILAPGADGDAEPEDDEDPDADSDESGGTDGGEGEPVGEDPQPELPFDPGQLAEVCARNNGDRVAQALCNGAQIDSIMALRQTLAFEAPFFSLTANSSSLVARNVSAINPRIVIGDRIAFLEEGAQPNSGLLALGFVRGEQFVELVGFDPVANDLNFYLLMFEQACNDSPEGCGVADLVTPAVEQDWTRWTLYQDVDLVNTTMDCNVCHQPLGPDTPKIPRVQEVSNSWTHWFPVRPPTEGAGWSSGGTGTQGIPVSDEENHGTRSSEVLWSLFEQMHGTDEAYGGVPLEVLRASAAGPDLETFVKSYLMMRPDLPEALRVPEDPFAVVSDYFCDSRGMELQGEASAWQQEFQRVLDGSRLPLPSHRIDITGPSERDAAIESYQQVVAGLANADDLLDPRDVVSADALTEMSIVPRPDASAQEILTHMCSRCHNSRLDQSLTRARFDATSLDTLSVLQKAAIADRIVREHGDALQMPPPRYGTLPDWAMNRVLEWLDP